jgi:putative adenylate-forming enzyme
LLLGLFLSKLRSAILAFRYYGRTEFVTQMHHPLQATISAAAHYVGAQWRWRTLDPTSLQELQEQRAGAIIAHAAQHSPFYRRHWQGHQLGQWRTLPTVDKTAMMAHFDEYNTCGIAAQAAMSAALEAERTRDFAPLVAGLTVGLSSGTSGHRGLFLVSPAEQAMWAGVILARALHKLRPGRTRVAFFLRSHSNLYQEVNGALLQLRYFDLMSPLADSIAVLNQYQPHILIGPPSLLGFLAAAHTHGSLRIHPQRLISVAEVLEPQDETLLATCFQAPVHQVYQCTEGLLAVSCPHGSLHIQEDIVAIQCEPLTPDLPQDAAGPRRVTPIVTDLWRRTQPIVRYRLNDVLQLGDKPCHCGSCFRTISRIEGRCDDVCYFFERNGSAPSLRRPFFPDTIRRMILLGSGGITDYQVVQECDGQLLVHLALMPGANRQQVIDAVRGSVNATVEQYGCHRPQLDIDTQLPPLPPGDKRRRVQRQ